MNNRRFLLLCSALLLDQSLPAATAPLNPSLAKGPLRVLPANPRYFTEDGHRAICLTGSHTWDNLQDLGEADPPARFDFNAYLDFLVNHEHNFIRLWRWELLRWATSFVSSTITKRAKRSSTRWA
jgi:hypothetical protein